MTNQDMRELYAIVALPKQPTEYTEDRGAFWNPYPFVATKDGEITVGATCEYLYTISPLEARGVAAALLAAANYAEEGK